MKLICVVEEYHHHAGGSARLDVTNWICMQLKSNACATESYPLQHVN